MFRTLILSGVAVLVLAALAPFVLSASRAVTAKFREYWAEENTETAEDTTEE